MLKVKIVPVSGFGHTAEFAGINVMSYDLVGKHVNCQFALFENLESYDYITSKMVHLSAGEIEAWGLDDMVLIDAVLTKNGFVRDTTWTTTTTAEETTTTVEETTTTFEEPTTTTTVEEPTTTVEETTTTTTIGE